MELSHATDLTSSSLPCLWGSSDMESSICWLYVSIGY